MTLSQREAALYLGYETVVIFILYLIRISHCDCLVQVFFVNFMDKAVFHFNFPFLIIVSLKVVLNLENVCEQRSASPMDDYIDSLRDKAVEG